MAVSPESGCVTSQPMISAPKLGESGRASIWFIVYLQRGLVGYTHEHPAAAHASLSRQGAHINQELFGGTKHLPRTSRQSSLADPSARAAYASRIRLVGRSTVDLNNIDRFG